MTRTNKRRATIKQIKQLEDAGADIVRVSCPDEDSTKALKKITKAKNKPTKTWRTCVSLLFRSFSINPIKIIKYFK